MDIQFGTETEIGITRAQPEEVDVVAESIALVRSTPAPAVRLRWDYRCEDPHCDARGFRVSQLLQDMDEARYVAQDAQRSLSYQEIKSDLVLGNGGRFYNDHAHPEYCTPECRSLLDLIQQEHAGESLLMECARRLNDSGPNPILLYKNNTDFRGHSYGCHENYLLPRSLPWETLSQVMVAFLVTRQIFAGAGKFGWETEDHFLQPGFQISQRSDFFSELQSIDTMQRRPIINTRDEPHADSSRYRRFHVIIGDSNLSPYATYLKVGATCLVLQALVHEAPPDAVPHLADPVGTLQQLSRDATWQWHCRDARGRPTRAVEVQHAYLQWVRQACPNLSPDWRAVADAWEEILRDLDRHPLATADRLDWSAKYRLIEQFREQENLPASAPWLRSLDLTYHLLDRDQGLFYGLLQQQAFRLPFPWAHISSHYLFPPATTRAAVRGRCIEKFGRAVLAAQWDYLLLGGRERKVELDLRNLFDANLVRESLALINQAKVVEDLLHLKFAKSV